MSVICDRHLVDPVSVLVDDDNEPTSQSQHFGLRFNVLKFVNQRGILRTQFFSRIWYIF